MQKYTIEIIRVDNDGNAGDHNQADGFYPAREVDAEIALLKAALRWLSENCVTLNHGVCFEGYVVQGETPIEIPAELAGVIGEAVKEKRNG
jgi:hypothetical protein